jgi:hypothetical protein
VGAAASDNAPNAFNRRAGLPNIDIILVLSAVRAFAQNGMRRKIVQLYGQIDQ